MASTSLQLKSKNAATEASITTTLSYVNPNADSATLKTFGKKLNALTTNNYVETNRVQTINVDTEEVPVTPTEPELTLNVTSGYTINNNYVQIPFSNFTYTGNGNIKAMFGVGAKQGVIGGAFAVIPGTDAISFPASSTGTYNLQLAIEGTTNFDDVVLYTTVTIS